MVVVSLDMFLNSTQDSFVKHRNDKFCLVKGKQNSGKTISTIFKALYLKRNYCFEFNDKILFLSMNDEIGQVADIFNYINKSDLYKSIIPSDNIEVHILTVDKLFSLNMGRIYTHIIIDNIESYDKASLSMIFSMFKEESYSKVYFIQNSIDNIDSVNSLVEYSRRVLKCREVLYKFRYEIEEDEQDEFTQISMSPEIKYSNYEYRDYVNFDTKEVIGYYTSCNSIYKDMGTFLYDLTHKSIDINLIDRNLKIKNSIKVLRDWVSYKKGLYFVEIDDEGMSKYDLFRGDIVMIDSNCPIVNNDVVVILKDGHLYSRKYIKCGDLVKFLSDESIFDEICLDSSVNILGKVIAYIRKYNNY